MRELFKRSIDLFSSALIFLLLVPIIIILCGLNLYYLGLPIFFKQKRMGYRETIFVILKFRTMKMTTNSSGELLSDEARVTPYGQFLRRYSLDELPTLINVIRGDMSLVGPRPLYPEYLNYYTSLQKTRHNVKPGLTGWAQVNGRNALSWEEKLKMDIWYVNNFSFLLDFKILFKTVTRVISARDINHKDHVTMPRFDEVVKANETK